MASQTAPSAERGVRRAGGRGRAVHTTSLRRDLISLAVALGLEVMESQSPILFVAMRLRTLVY